MIGVELLYRELAQAFLIERTLGPQRRPPTGRRVPMRRQRAAPQTGEDRQPPALVAERPGSRAA
ncbi:MAG TPA: hypothetical protein VNL95_01910 [Dehalococcoidia bacterium]|nr:hypothetical protein [Dehalococcoidia bacterium]